MTRMRNKPFPRATVKKIIKGHADKSVGRNVDALVSTTRADLGAAKGLTLFCPGLPRLSSFRPGVSYSRSY
jgi:hypothetical protein